MHHGPPSNKIKKEREKPPRLYNHDCRPGSAISAQENGPEPRVSLLSKNVHSVQLACRRGVQRERSQTAS